MRNVLIWILGCGLLCFTTLSVQADATETVEVASNASSVSVSTETCHCQTTCQAEQQQPWWVAKRLPPPGTLHPRYPYATFRMNYYDRPYGPGQEATAVIGRTGTAAFDPQPYRTRLFDELDARFTQQVAEDGALKSYYLEAQGAGTAAAVHDGYLEYQDWRKHRDARLEWEQRRQPEEELPRHRSTRRTKPMDRESN